MLFFTAAILLCSVRDAQCKTRESPMVGIVNIRSALTTEVGNQFRVAKCRQFSQTNISAKTCLFNYLQVLPEQEKA